MTEPSTLTRSTPAPTAQSELFLLLRSLLTLSGVVGVGWGAAVNDGTLMVVAGALLAVAREGLALWEMFRAARRDHTNSVASAEVGVPVKVA